MTEEGTVNEGMFLSRAVRSISAISSLPIPWALSTGSHEDRTDYASVKACCSNDAAADGSNKDGALADQLQHGTL